MVPASRPPEFRVALGLGDGTAAGLVFPVAAGAAAAASRVLVWAEARSILVPTTRRPPRSFITATHPARDCLAISLSEPACLGPLVRTVRSRRETGGVTGVRGLRV